jgi:hypothetical protein
VNSSQKKLITRMGSIISYTNLKGVGGTYDG